MIFKKNYSFFKELALGYFYFFTQYLLSLIMFCRYLYWFLVCALYTLLKLKDILCLRHLHLPAPKSRLQSKLDAKTWVVWAALWFVWWGNSHLAQVGPQLPTLRTGPGTICRADPLICQQFLWTPELFPVGYFWKHLFTSIKD